MLQKNLILLGITLILVPAFAPLALSSDPSTVALIDFDRQIRPILSETCYTCHGPDGNKLKAGLRMDRKESVFGKLESGTTAVVAGQPSESEMIRRITSANEDSIMPPPEAEKKLSQAQIDLLTAWVKQGARWTNHWSFEPIRSSAVPQDGLADGRVLNPIDAFVLEKLKQSGQVQSPTVNKAMLIRRASLDLTGLPPSIVEVDEFLGDHSAQAFEKVVDRLLASQQYGERMAMPWLDLARYGDTSGYHNDSLRDMWLWREWVIHSFNANMPFDQFTIEQLAGDLLPNSSIQQQIASGFHRNVMTSDEGGLIDNEYRNLYVVDRVNTTGVAWLGMTVGCSQCHDHKYDPLTQTDYYRLYAFFNNVPENGKDGVRDRNPKPFLRVPSTDDQEQIKRFENQLVEADAKLAELSKGLNEKQATWETQLLATTSSSGQQFAKADAHFSLDENGDGIDAMGQPIPAQTGGSPKHVEGVQGKSLLAAGKNWFEYGDRFGFQRDQSFSVSAYLWVTKEGGSPFGKMNDGDGARGWDLEFHGLRPSLHLIHKWPDNAIHIQADEDLPEKVFTHLAFTYDGSGKALGLKLYVNGALAKTSVKIDSLDATIQSSVPFFIGRRSNSSTPFHGRVDDVRIYQRQLTAAEVGETAMEEILKIASIPLDQRSAKQKEQIEKHFKQTQMPELATAEKTVADLRKSKEDFENKLPNTMVMSEMEKPRDTFVKVRGNYDLDGAKVEAGVPNFLPQITSESDGRPLNRLHLAQWLVAPSHPLTARVAVNRWWAMLFGTGLVKTLNDFGTQGERPSHPELLDWLAADYMRDWDTKRVIKQIVMSATYQQSARVSPSLQAMDQENRWLARGPRQRLDAELLRDNALAVAGILNPILGGKSIKPAQPEGTWEINEMSGYKYDKSKGADLYRRGLYVYWRRSTVYPSFVTLDAPTREFCVAQRAKTSTPLQSLVLMNDPVFVEAARAFAQRILTDRKPAQDSSDRLKANRLVYAWRLALARTPSTEEFSILNRTLDQQLTKYRADVEAAKKLASVGDLPKPDSIDDSELAAWTALCNVLLNLNETISN